MNTDLESSLNNIIVMDSGHNLKKDPHSGVNYSVTRYI